MEPNDLRPEAMSKHNFGSGGVSMSATGIIVVVFCDQLLNMIKLDTTEVGDVTDSGSAYHAVKGPPEELLSCSKYSSSDIFFCFSIDTR